jgi:hypothetical protein
LPPIKLKSGQGITIGFQLCEPDMEGINENGKHSPLYSTFGRIGSEYYYLGLNFEGEIKSRYITWKD